MHGLHADAHTAPDEHIHTYGNGDSYADDSTERYACAYGN
jgi:hypothetical protein